MRTIRTCLMVFRIAATFASVLLATNVGQSAPPSISIVDCDDSGYTMGLLGQHVFLYVKLNSDEALSRADIRINYEFPGLTFLGATAVNDFAQWEYFTWNHIPDTTRPDSGYSAIQLTAVADLDNGVDVHPNASVLAPNGPVISLRFWLSNDQNLINQCESVSLVSDACGQTALHDASGTLVYVLAGSDGSCYASLGKTVMEIGSMANGAICLLWIDDRGDINLDGVVYNIGDAALFVRYFIYGAQVWDPKWRGVQELETDLNGDGLVGTVEDYKFLVKVLSNGHIYQPDPCW